MLKYIVDAIGGPVKTTSKVILSGSIATTNYLTTTNEPIDSPRRRLMNNYPQYYYSHIMLKSIIFGFSPLIMVGVALVNPKYVYQVLYTPVDNQIDSRRARFFFGVPIF